MDIPKILHKSNKVNNTIFAVNNTCCLIKDLGFQLLFAVGPVTSVEQRECFGFP